MRLVITIVMSCASQQLKRRIVWRFDTPLYYQRKIIMESPAFFYTVFLSCLLISITGYSLYVGFGPPSQQLRDPFEEHED